LADLGRTDKEHVMYPLNINQLPIEVKKIGEQNVEHVRSLATGYIRFLQRGLEGLGASGEGTFGIKILGYAEANVESALDLTAALMAAKNVSEIWTLQNEFIQSQMRTVTEQAKDLAGSAMKAIPSMH
jgi:hypothetical protein